MTGSTRQASDVDLLLTFLSKTATSCVRTISQPCHPMFLCNGSSYLREEKHHSYSPTPDHDPDHSGVTASLRKARSGEGRLSRVTAELSIVKCWVDHFVRCARCTVTSATCSVLNLARMPRSKCQGSYRKLDTIAVKQWQMRLTCAYTTGLRVRLWEGWFT